MTTMRQLTLCWPSLSVGSSRRTAGSSTRRSRVDCTRRRRHRCTNNRPQQCKRNDVPVTANRCLYHIIVPLPHTGIWLPHNRPPLT